MEGYVETCNCNYLEGYEVSCTISLKEDVLYAQLLFVNGYITGFFYKHLQWHKQICPKSNRAGFRAVDMGVNLYIMYHDLEDLKVNWRIKDFMAPFVQIIFTWRRCSTCCICGQLVTWATTTTMDA
mmetsp:Transcript_17639/g.21054  ORF Transcript_17639/g.21054 Transcript_17639/m.21054 type:complete len:126 (+) Transcript_17639:46-423(+)